MTQRPLHLRQSMTAGIALALAFTTLNVIQSENRLWAFVLTTGFCAVMLMLVFLVVRAAQGRREPR